jgi:hypothetical protein
MRALVLCAVVMFGCSKKSETKNEPAKNEPVAEAPATKPAETKPAEAPKPPDEKPAPTGAPKVDCAAIVTADDYKKACNANVEIAPTMYEGQGSLMVCNRKVDVDKKATSLRWGLASFPDAEAVQNWIKMTKYDETKDIAGVGDAAWITKRTSQALKVTDHEVVVRKGGLLMILGTTEGSLKPKGPCSIDQLVEVAKLATARLP